MVLGDDMLASAQRSHGAQAAAGSSRRAPLVAEEFRGGALGLKGQRLRMRGDDEAAGF